MSAWYNENDEEKAAWLRELIKAGVIAPGRVDERSITEIEAHELRPYDQCHFFAGIGVWSYALRLAGWPDHRPVWTGSCPCPSFSCAGKGTGFDDPRHLWPAWEKLIRIGKPAAIFGEQADDAIGYGWLDLVQTDLESASYAVGKAVLGACSVGAPHIRQRLYFVAHSEEAEVFARFREDPARTRPNQRKRSRECGASLELAHTDGRGQSVCGIAQEGLDAALRIEGVRMGEPIRTRLERHGGNAEDGHQSGWFGAHSHRSAAETSFVNGFWRDADWVLRKRWNREDFEWCPTEPGTFPLAHGVANRVLKLRGYGDAICAEVAKAFIEAYMSL